MFRVRARVAVVAAACVVSLAAAVGAQAVKNADAAKLKNPAKVTPASLDAGQATYKKYCAFCHNDDGKGNGPMAPKGTTPSNLVDANWDFGQTDGEIFV